MYLKVRTIGQRSVNFSNTRRSLKYNITVMRRQCDQTREARPQVSEPFNPLPSLGSRGITAMIKHQGRRNDLPCSISDPIVLLLPFLSLVLDIPARIVEASLWFVVVLYARWTCLFNREIIVYHQCV